MSGKRMAGVFGLDRPVSLEQHRKRCRVCHHRRREEIERDFLDWMSAEAIRKKYQLSDRSAIYRHAHAFRLFEGRRRGLRIVLERMLERGEEVQPTAATIVSAVRALAKINALGEWFEREDHRVYLQKMFDQMTHDELDLYAREGKVPERFCEPKAGAPALGAGTVAKESAAGSCRQKAGG